MKIVIEPRFCDMDVLGHVTNSVIPQWFEHGRLHYFRYFSEAENFADLKLILKCYSVDFEHEIQIGSDVVLITDIQSIRRSSIIFRHEAYQNERLVVRGECIMVHFDYDQKKSIPIPEKLKRSLQPSYPQGN